MELDRLNPVTLITGAASGIGAACASLLSHRSEGGLILVDHDEAALDKTADCLSRPPERVSTLAFDIANQGRWADAAQFIQSHYGRVDWAIVNVGGQSAPSTETDLVDWRRDARADLEGVFLSLRAVMPLMRDSAQGGSIIVTAPAQTLEPSERAGAYAAARAGLLQLVRAAAREGVPARVRVNAIAPGGAETPTWAEMHWFQDLVRDQGSERGAFEALAAMPAPIARYAATDDITRLITMLLSDACPVTGATLVVDGGYAI